MPCHEDCAAPCWPCPVMFIACSCWLVVFLILAVVSMDTKCRGVAVQLIL